MGSAFHHDEAVRQAALARLQAAAQAGRLQGGHVAWTVDKCSVVGAMTGTDVHPAGAFADAWFLLAGAVFVVVAWRLRETARVTLQAAMRTFGGFGSEFGRSDGEGRGVMGLRQEATMVVMTLASMIFLRYSSS